MKKFYTIFTLMLLSLAGFAAQAAVEVNINCYTGYQYLVVRDGAPDAEPIEITSSYQAVTLEGETLYISVDNEDYKLSTVNYGPNYSYATVTDGVCTIPVENLNDGDNVNVNLSKLKSVTFNVPDPELVVIKPNSYSDPYEIVKGANTFRIGEYDGMYMELKDKENYRLTRVYRIADNKAFSVTGFYYCSMYSYDLNDGDVFSYVIVPADEFEAPSFKVRVDEPANAIVQADYNDIEDLVANEWKTVEMSGSAAQIYVRHASYGTDFFYVKKNGVAQSDSYGSYSFSVEDGDEVDVRVAFPDEDYNITIDLPEGCDSYFNSVSVDGEEVENWREGLVVHCGKRVKFDMNYSLYDLNSITVNGNAVDTEYIYGTWEYKATEDAVIEFDVTKKPTYTVDVWVKDASAVTAQINYNSVKLVDGDNTLEYTMTNGGGSLSITANAGATINSIVVSVNGEVVERSQSNLYYTLTGEPTTIKVDVDPMVRDRQFVAYFDMDLSEKYYYYFSTNIDQVDRAIAKGYNLVPFAASEERFYFSTYPTDGIYMYLNGEALAPTYEGGSSYYIFPADGDVLKVYDGKEPQTYAATFSVTATQQFTAVKDLIVPVENFSEALSDFEGTEIVFTPAVEQKLNITVNDADNAAEARSEGEAYVPENEDGTYTVVLDGNKSILIEDADNSGVESVADALAAAPADVYTVTGALVLRNATPAQLEALPAGIYIVGGAKYVQK